MGIKNLNSYFRQKCTKESIKQKHLSYYRNKTIVIDTKQNTNEKKFDNDRILEIGNEESARKKVFNKYSSKKKKDFSFFSDALSE